MSLLFTKSVKLGLLLRLICLFIWSFSVCISTPPEDHIKCSSSSNTNCTITNSYGIFPDRSMCRAGTVAYPSNEEELTKNKIKMKVATRYSHSIPKLVCPSEEDGLIISTKHLNRVVEIDAEAKTMTLESGVTLKQLISEAAKAGLALPYTPYWWGLTIGGLLGTGAHGSTLWSKGSSVHDYVVGLTIVSPGGPKDGYVKVRRLNDGDKDLNAAKVSLGVLGVISQINCLRSWFPEEKVLESDDTKTSFVVTALIFAMVGVIASLIVKMVTLNLQPMFKRAITYLSKSDSDLGDQVVRFGKEHEFADIIWYPSQHKAVYRMDDRVSTNTSGNGLYDFIPFRATPSLALPVISATEENQESQSDADGKCTSAKLVTSTLITSAYGLTNNGLFFTGYPVIGYQHRLQSSGTCLDSLEDSRITACPWDPKIKGEFFHQTTFSINLSLAKNFIQDVQKLVEIEPKALCGVEIYNGILMRYVTTSSAYLGKQEDAVDFDITYYRSKDPMTPRLYEGILEEIEQLALVKYKALPHWGKNRNIAFDGVMNKYKGSEEFLRVKDVYDPMGLFSSEWTDQVLGLKDGVTIVKEGCALEGLCICSKDIHCAPSKRYFCRPGKVFNDARICTLVTTNQAS